MVTVVLGTESTSNAEVTLLVVALVILTGPLLAERLRLPGLVGLVLGGTIAGPFVLGWLEAGSLDGVGGIGLLYLMFMAGVELDLGTFEHYRSAALSFGLLTFLLPLSFGFTAGLVLDFTLAASILLGSIWASHTLVSYPQVRQAGLESNRAVATAVGATVITDTLALVVLAMVSSSQGSEGLSGVEVVVRLSLGLTALVLYSLILLPRIGRWFWAGPGSDRTARFVFILGAISSAGLLAELGGIEGIVGAFFAGLGLNRLVPNGGRLMERVEFFGSAFFIPAFLIMVGMLIEPALFFDLGTLRMSAVFLVALVVGKGLAAWISGRRQSFSTGEVGVMFSLTLAQAAATLAASLVGLDIGLFTEEVFNAILLVVVVSLVASSVGTRSFARRIEPERLVIRPLGSSVLALVVETETVESLMSISSSVARSDGGLVTAMVVVPETEEESAFENAKRLLARAEEAATSAGADVEGDLRVDTSLSEGALRKVAEQQPTLVVVEWVTEGLDSLLFGSEVDRIGMRSPVPLVAARLSLERIQRVIVAAGSDDGTVGYRTDLQVAIDFASRVSGGGRLPLHILVAPVGSPSGLELPQGARVETLERVGLEPVVEFLGSGDLVVAPWASVQRLVGTRAARMLAPGVSVAVAAGPNRLSLTSAHTHYDAAGLFGYRSSAVPSPPQ